MDEIKSTIIFKIVEIQLLEFKQSIRKKGNKCTKEPVGFY